MFSCISCVKKQTIFNVSDPEKMACFTFDKKEFIGIPTNIYDGDTLCVVFEYNKEIVKYKCRCLGYDSPEMKPLLSNPNREHEKTLAQSAKTRFTELLRKNKTIKIKCHGFDKYGRILVEIWNGIDSESINSIMIKEGHGKPYDGGHKESWI